MSTVTAYFEDDDPKGPLYAFSANSDCRMDVVPRSKLPYLKKQKELQKPAFYILIGDDGSIKPRAYIGETDNFCKRVKQHDRKKAFWQKALIFVSQGENLDKSKVLYLEHEAIAAAKKVNSFELIDNKQTPQAPYLSEYLRADMDDFFKDVKFLASFLGYNIFDEAQHKTERIFYTKARGCNAKGFYNSSTNEFTVMKGSVVAATTTKSFKGKDEREKLLEELCTEKLLMKADKTFDSPSAAADFCIGRSCNGWVEWKDKEESLDSVYRRQPD